MEINKINEKKISDFCRKVCSNLDEPNKVKKNIEKELVSNIKEKAMLYIEDGKNRDLAVSMALDEYGTVNKLLKEISYEYKLKNFTCNKLLGLASILFLISILLISVYYLWNSFYIQRDYNLVTMDVESFVNKKVGNQESLSILVKENPTVEAIWTTVTYTPMKKNTYVYPDFLNIDSNKYSKKNSIFLRTVVHGYISDISNNSFKIEMNVAQTYLKNTILYIGGILLISSLLLLLSWFRKNKKYRSEIFTPTTL